jgi:hypothetical protein
MHLKNASFFYSVYIGLNYWDIMRFGKNERQYRWNKDMKVRRIAFPIMISLLLIVLVLSACQPAAVGTNGSLDQSVAQTMAAIPTITPIPTLSIPTVTPTNTPVKYGPTDFPANVNPLTGLVVADPSIMNRRPVMIKVSNFPREGRPHAGLSKADIVFDYSVGEGGDRFLALYYSQDSDNIGPVRSGRLIDRWLVSMYQGILGMKLAYIDVLNKINEELGKSRVVNASYKSCPAICQLDYSPSAISWFANSAEMTNYYVKETGQESFTPNLDGMTFNSIPPSGGVDGHDFTMHFGHANEGQWIYDPATKKYKRWIENILDPQTESFNMIPLVDRNTNEQLAFSNVIVVFVVYESLTPLDTIDEVHFEGASGKMMLFRDGMMFEGMWKSTRPDVPLQFFDAAGNHLDLQPGNTWIDITGYYSGVDQTSPGVWYVTFAKP